MDTSEIYVRMSDCEAVQFGRKLKVGDYVAVWDGQHYRETYQPLIVVSIRKDGLVLYSDGKGKNEGWDTTILLKQDQIQEMMGIKTAESFRNMVDDMFYTRDGGLYDTMNDEWFVEEIKTPEQLWLAFYMFKSHQKIWDGKKWVKSVKE